MNGHAQMPTWKNSVKTTLVILIANIYPIAWQWNVFGKPDCTLEDGSYKYVIILLQN